jgi:hypothetical protein
MEKRGVVCTLFSGAGRVFQPEGFTDRASNFGGSNRLARRKFNTDLTQGRGAVHSDLPYFPASTAASLASWSARSFSVWPLWPLTHCHSTW